MKVALIADAGWLRHEATQLRHLVVGLADEGVRTTAVVPKGPTAGQLTLVGERIDYQPSRRWWVENLRLIHSGRGLKDDEELDLIHILDASLGPAAWWLGRKLGLPVVCSCWSEADIALAHRWRGSGPMVHTVGSSGLMEAGSRSGVGDARFELVRPGVITGGDEVKEPLGDPRESLCCLVMSGEATGPLGVLLDGVGQVRKRYPQLQLFLYTQDPRHNGRLWQQVVKRDLAGVVSMVGQDAGSQSLLVHSDALLMPGALSVVRTLVLTEMAAGRPVIAAPDAALDYLIEGRTARLAEDWTAEDWAGCFDEMVSKPEELRKLGASAREYVREHHGAASFVARMLEVYRLAAAEPMPFGKV